MSHEIPRDEQVVRTIPPRVMTLIRLAIGGIVIVAVVRAGSRAAQELDHASLDWSQVRWRWLCIAGALYAASQIPQAAYWHRTLAAMGVRVRFTTALRGFVAGQLGKYVPGKLMVVIIRSGLLQLPGSQASRAVSSVFVETFTFMAVGAFLAGMGGCVFFRREWVLQLTSLAVMALMVLLTSPMLIRFLIRWMPQTAAMADADADRGGITYGLIATGWMTSLAAWTLSTASLCATLYALPVGSDNSFPWAWDAPFRLGTSLAAAVVLGFASMLPGGLGAREYVLDRLLVPTLGELHAITVTLLLRVVWLLTEVLTSTILYLNYVRRGSGRPR